MTESIIGGLVGLVLTIIGWIVNRHADRIDALEKDYVSKEFFNSVIQQMKEERLTYHQEIKETLVRVESKIDRNEERAASTRHDTRDQVHVLGLKVAELGAKL